MIEAEIDRIEGCRIAIEQASVRAQQVDRLIADIEDAFILRETLVQGIRHNRRRVGVVEDPGLRRAGADFLDQRNHVADGAHTVGKAACAAGFLPDDAEA